MSWTDFNNAEEPRDFDAMPKGTMVKVRMSIKPGGYDDPSQGWTGGYATRNNETGSIYLDAEFVVLEGEYARRKFWMLIGLHSEGGPMWSDMGRTMIKGVLNSARGLDPKDQSPASQQARCIQGFHELDGVVFVAKLGVEKGLYGDHKNTVGIAVTRNDKRYASLMSDTVNQASSQGYQPPTSKAPAVSPPSGRPSWAQ